MQITLVLIVICVTIHQSVATHDTRSRYQDASGKFRESCDVTPSKSEVLPSPTTSQTPGRSILICRMYIPGAGRSRPRKHLRYRSMVRSRHTHAYVDQIYPGPEPGPKPGQKRARNTAAPRSSFPDMFRTVDHDFHPDNNMTYNFPEI